MAAENSQWSGKPGDGRNVSNHSSSLALCDFRLPFVFVEAEVGDTQLRGALDKFQAGNPHEFGSLAAGDEASPIQLEPNHFTRRLPDRLAQSRQETAEVFAEIQNRGIHRGCSSFMVPLTPGPKITPVTRCPQKKVPSATAS